MFEGFALRHIPGLMFVSLLPLGGAAPSSVDRRSLTLQSISSVASTMTFGGLWPIFDAKGAMTEFGFPASIASASAAGPVMVIGQVRGTIIGASGVPF